MATASNTWTGRYDLLVHPIEFITANGNEEWNNRGKLSSSLPADCLTGDEAKKIYEDILSEQRPSYRPTPIEVKEEKQIINLSNLPQKRTSLSLRKNKNCAEISLTKTDLFKAAQSGDLDVVKTCIESGKLDVNITDQYSWTPLMMAAYEGHEDIVLFLLTEDAVWMDVIDGSGYDARDLACLGGRHQVVDILMNSERYIRKHKVTECEERATRTIKREKLWCEMCKAHYYARPGRSKLDPHLSSTLHLISNKDSSRPCATHFYIPGSNKGYKLMRQGGWDGESGLGRDRDGQKYPVKTILKRDRLGFGAEGSEKKPRVTHFAANDRSAVKRHDTLEREWTSKTARKKYFSQKEEESKEKEINFRRLFH